MSLTDDPLIGRQLGDYRIVDILGRGGMAHVYRGYDAKLQRYAAVKVIDANLLAKENDDEYRRRFQREARAVARLNHPSIVGVYQFGEVGPLYYMAMAFIEGRDLGHILKEHIANGTMMSPEQIVQIIRDIGGALDYAHAGGVIHRDIKPSNIMVAAHDGRAILTDFGLALSVREGSIGNTFGSAHYIAPEQAISSANSVAQSDLYSLGVVLYQMLTGKVPFDDPSAMSVAIKHLSDPPPSPRVLNPELNLAVEKVVLKALEKEPSKRFQNGESMAVALEEALLRGETMSDEQLASITSSRPSRAFPLVTLTKEVEAAQANPPSLPFVDAQLTAARGQLENARRRFSQPLPPLSRRTGLIGGAGVVIVLVALIGLWAVTRGRSAADVTATAVVAALSTEEASPTVTRTAVTATAIPDTPTAAPTRATAAVIVPAAPTATSSATPTATATPTPTFSATASPSATASSTKSPSHTPTATAASTEASAPPTGTADSGAQVWLLYDDKGLVLVNRSTTSVSIRGWEFVQDASFGQITFYSGQWQTPLLGSVRPGQCYVIWPNSLPDLGTPDYCSNREAWFAAGTLSRFWISSHKDATFRVLDITGAVLAVCRVDAGECSIKVG